jgi:hypothetical protein
MFGYPLEPALEFLIVAGMTNMASHGVLKPKIKKLWMPDYELRA